jgi:hypothetical protein
MTKRFTEEALALWNELSDEEQDVWTTGVSCQKCQTKIEKTDFNGSIYEGQLALFHECQQCSNKEVRLIDISPQNQQEIDDDFERWKKQKQAEHPERFND